MYVYLGKPDLAIIDYTNLLKVHPDDPDALIKRGDIYFKKGDNTKALADYNMAMKVEIDESPHIYEKRAKVLRKMGRNDQAMEDEKKALKLRRSAVAIPKI